MINIFKKRIRKGDWNKNRSLAPQSKAAHVSSPRGFSGEHVSIQRAIGNQAFQLFLRADGIQNQKMDDQQGEDQEQRNSELSTVRLHTGAHAEESAEALGARAYTVGDNIVFGRGQYAPETSEGRRLINHELAHVAQQRTGRVPHDTIQRFKDPYHEQVIESGLKGTKLQETWREVYFGSWLRDFSQLIESDSDATFKKAIVFVLNKMAQEKFKLTVDEKRLGYYRAEEHMDNPSITPPATEKPITSAVGYAERELKLAVQSGRNTAGRIHFGQALHAVEDFFSHTNFVRNAVQMCKKPGTKPGRLVSGAFGAKDKKVSLLELLVNFVKSRINWSEFTLTPIEKLRQAIRKVIPLPTEMRIPDVYYQDPRQHPENKLWFEALDVLEPRLALARKEAMAAVPVPTHSELHQDDPGRPLYRIAFALAEYVTHQLAILMDLAWTGDSTKNLEKMYTFIRKHLQGPEKGDWWKDVLKSKGVLKCK